MTYDHWKSTNPADEWLGPDPDDEEDDECPNCFGEGVVYDCFEEYACIDPESGCSECRRRCDWCCPPRASQVQP